MRTHHAFRQRYIVDSLEPWHAELRGLRCFLVAGITRPVSGTPLDTESIFNPGSLFPLCCAAAEKSFSDQDLCCSSPTKVLFLAPRKLSRTLRSSTIGISVFDFASATSSRSAARRNFGGFSRRHRRLQIVDYLFSFR